MIGQGHAMRVTPDLFVLLRAYKLGKGRWSYNKCSLILRHQQFDGHKEDRQLTVSKAAAYERSIGQRDDQVGAHLTLAPHF